MTTAADTRLRIGELAEAVGTTPRTIRYYEELGLLGAGATRAAGAHRTYGPEDVERLARIMRLRDLLGVSLEELREILEAEAARPALRVEFQRAEDDDRRREIIVQSLANVERQLDLVRRRTSELDALAGELRNRRRRLRAALRAVS